MQDDFSDDMASIDIDAQQIDIKSRDTIVPSDKEEEDDEAHCIDDYRNKKQNQQMKTRNA